MIVNCAYVPVAIVCGVVQLMLRPAIRLPALALVGLKPNGSMLCSELSVIGFDNITMSNYTDPPLTTVGVEKEYLGRRAMTRLLELVEGTDEMIKTEHVPVELIVRGSTARAKRNLP